MKRLHNMTSNLLTHLNTILICVMLLLPLQNFAQIARLRSFLTEHITEKTYLHFDKPYYAAGDTMYFKAYATMGERHVPSRISSILHVDLINMQNKIDQSIKLQLVNGISWGDFALPDSLHKGTYRVRAWTQWMRNDPGIFFEKTKKQKRKNKSYRLASK